MLNINDNILKLLLESSAHHDNFVNSLSPADKNDWQGAVNQGRFWIETQGIDKEKSNHYEIRSLLFRKASEENIIDSWIITVGGAIVETDNINLTPFFNKKRGIRILCFPEQLLDELRQSA